MIKERYYGLPRTLTETFESGMDRPQPPWVEPFDSMPIINLGAGYKFLHRSVPMGLEQGWRAGEKIPFSDGKVGGIFSYHLFEHLTKDELFSVLRECERVLALGAPLTVVVPHHMSEGAYHDLDHKLFFTESTWRNLMQNTYYDGSMPRDWSFEIGTNLIVGLNFRNLAVVTQLIRVEGASAA